MIRLTGLTLAILIGIDALISWQAFSAQPSDRATGSTVGIPAKRWLLVPSGAAIVPKPLIDRNSKMIVRVLDSIPVGNQTRYELSYYGLEPGTFDLKDYLEREDKSPLGNTGPTLVQVRSVLPPGQIEPNSLRTTPATFTSHYRWWMFGAAVAWFAGLIAIALVGKRRREPEAVAARPPLTLADRLRPLVERAMAGTAQPSERAELERTLIDYWRRKLGYQSLAPGAAIALIRADPTAGALLRQLEAWLHQPPGEAEPVDLNALLEPYRNLTAIEADADLVGASSAEGVSR